MKSRIVLDDRHDWDHLIAGCVERLDIPQVSRITTPAGESILSIQDLVHGDDVVVHP